MKQDTHEFEFEKKVKKNRRPRASAPADTGPPPIVWQLAFAHRVEKEINSGIFPNRAAAARHYGITRARLTQIMNLLWLAPGVQEGIMGTGGNGQRLSERVMRKPAARIVWGEQCHVKS